MTDISLTDSGDLDLDAWWQPFTNVRGFRRHPRLLARAQGCFV